MCNRKSCVILLCSFLCIHGYAEDCVSRENELAPVRLTVRHIEANGIGYTQGYTTIDGFFSSFFGQWLPFIDVRGHAFNSGRLAANAGIGARYCDCSRVWGISTYYDYRNTTHHTFQQWSLGLESLGERWDVRLNGYFPFGSKVSDNYNTQFDHFSNHFAIGTQQYQFALKGANAEVGMHSDSISNHPLYLAAGPYYWTGKQTTWGAEARMAFDVCDYLRLEASTSYDHLFHWIGQGQISLICPFGKAKQCRSSCSFSRALNNRMVQRVDRSEIIPVSQKRKEIIAINPLTNHPQFFIFVDNLSHSKGTFKSPYPSLLQAETASKPGDIIYVFGGDGSSRGMDSGFLMKSRQRLWGAGTSQNLPTTQGNWVIPSFTKLSPKITSASHAVITLSDRCEVSGINVIKTDSTNNFIFGILGGGEDGISNPVINSNVHNNLIDLNVNNNVILNNASGIQIFGMGNVAIANNKIIIGHNGVNTTQLIGIHGISLDSQKRRSVFTVNENLVSILESTTSPILDLRGIYIFSSSQNESAPNHSQLFINNNLVQISQSDSDNNGIVTLFGISSLAYSENDNDYQMQLTKNRVILSQTKGIMENVVGIGSEASIVASTNNNGVCLLDENQVTVNQGSQGRIGDLQGFLVSTGAEERDNSINKITSNFVTVNQEAGGEIPLFLQGYFISVSANHTHTYTNILQNRAAFVLDGVGPSGFLQGFRITGDSSQSGKLFLNLINNYSAPYPISILLQGEIDLMLNSSGNNPSPVIE